MRTRIDCCHKCTRPWKSPYCHNIGVCPDYTGQRAELDESRKEINLKSITAQNLCGQRLDSIAMVQRKRRV